MDRDDLIIRVIAEGASSSAEMAVRTGLSPASVCRGLRQLQGSEHVFSPARGVYRLTPSGERVLRPSRAEPGSAPDQAPQDDDPGSLVTSSIPARDPDPAARQADVPKAEPRPVPEPSELPGGPARTGGRAAVPAWLVGGALVALGVGVIALYVIVARPPAPAPPAVDPLAQAWPPGGQSWGW